MNNMNNMNNSISQQSLNNSTNQNQQSTYIKSEVQSPRGDSVYLKDKEILPRKNKTIYVNENKLPGNSDMSSSTDIINITLTSTSGLKVVIAAQKNMSLS